ncbi:uncharacterized protein LOC126700644 [Quercus robur]|uniref:uncharacterized protein LOC126700644 n=1 Tax=Quercus robur TaxID=38942 RepID=UPI0021627952|nr:uncharacterized protein LOC126700644 [Quercus robur]
MSSSSGNYSGSCGHLCTYETCVLRTSLTVDNFGRRFLGCSRYKIGPKCPFFRWIDNPTCVRGNEAAHLVQQKLDLLRSELQLACEREREATQAAAEATQMAEITQGRAAKAIERERKFRVSSVQAKEIAVRALKQERKCRIALILSWFFFVLVMLFSCFSSSENVEMMRLSLPDGL